LHDNFIICRRRHARFLTAMNILIVEDAPKTAALLAGGALALSEVAWFVFKVPHAR